MLTQPNQCAEIQNARCKHETTEMYASAMPAFDVNIPGRTVRIALVMHLRMHHETA